MKYEKHVSEPWFTLIKLGKKTHEGRLFTGDFAQIKKGDFITFFNNDFDISRRVTVQITNTERYETFEVMLVAIGLDKCLPGIDYVDQGVAIYKKYYSIERQRESGVVAIEMRIEKN